MYEIIAGVLIAFFVIIGITEGIHSLTGFFLKKPDDRVRYLIVSRGHDEKIEYIIRSLIHDSGTQRLFNSKPMIIIINSGMDKETMETCKILSDEFGCIEICLPEQFPMLLKKEVQT